MHAHGDAAAHMGHDETQRIIVQAVLCGVPLGDGLLIEGMEAGTAGEIRTAGEFGQLRHLVNNRRVDHIGRATDFRADFRSQNSAQVAHMGAVGAVAQILQHPLVDGVGAAQQGRTRPPRPTMASNSSILTPC